jgi:hypothetical protein
MNPRTLLLPSSQPKRTTSTQVRGTDRDVRQRSYVWLMIQTAYNASSHDIDFEDRGTIVLGRYESDSGYLYHVYINTTF